MIIPSSKYPAQTAIDLTNYPQGKARNDTSDGSGDGTPLERDWVNDWFGFQQALVVETGITPSGTPDMATASQVLDMIRLMVLRRQIATYQIAATSPVAIGSNYALTLEQQFGGYVLSGNAVQVPQLGAYLVTVSGELDSSLTANPQEISVSIAVNGVANPSGTGYVRRYSATPGQVTTLHKAFIVGISTPAAQRISVIATSAQTEFSFPGQLMIDRLS